MKQVTHFEFNSLDLLCVRNKFPSNVVISYTVHPGTNLADLQYLIYVS